jgi:hypothetical protein
MSSTSDDMHDVFLADRSAVVPNRNVITVQAIRRNVGWRLRLKQSGEVWFAGIPQEQNLTDGS